MLVSLVVLFVVLASVTAILYRHVRRHAVRYAAASAPTDGDPFTYNSRRHPFVGLSAAHKKRPSHVIGIVTRVGRSGRVSIVNRTTGDRVRRQIGRLDIPARGIA